MKEQILYGTKNGDPEWKEQILSTKPENFDRVKVLAKRDGFINIRVSNIDLDKKPDFTNAIV